MAGKFTMRGTEGSAATGRGDADTHCCSDARFHAAVYDVIAQQLVRAHLRLSKAREELRDIDNALPINTLQ